MDRFCYLADEDVLVMDHLSQFVFAFCFRNLFSQFDDTERAAHCRRFVGDNPAVASFRHRLEDPVDIRTIQIRQQVSRLVDLSRTDDGSMSTAGRAKADRAGRIRVCWHVPTPVSLRDPMQEKIDSVLS